MENFSKELVFGWLLVILGNDRCVVGLINHADPKQQRESISVTRFLAVFDTLNLGIL